MNCCKFGIRCAAGKGNNGARLFDNVWMIVAEKLSRRICANGDRACTDSYSPVLEIHPKTLTTTPPLMRWVPARCLRQVNRLRRRLRGGGRELESDWQLRVRKGPSIAGRRLKAPGLSLIRSTGSGLARYRLPHWTSPSSSTRIGATQEAVTTCAS